MVNELKPTSSQKSFYGKAKVKTLEDGTQILYSYGTPIVKRKPDGSLLRLWNGWSATTGRHVASFCGINKRQFLALEM